MAAKKDFTQIAFAVVQQATGATAKKSRSQSKPKSAVPAVTKAMPKKSAKAA